MPAEGESRARSPRVAHIVPALFDRKRGIIGGGERYALELARHMADRVPTRLVTFGDTDHREEIGALSVRVIGHPWFVRGQRTNPVALRMLSELRDADVIHCHQLQGLAEGRRVTFHEGYADDALLAAYHRALCIVLPSVYESEFGGLNLVPELLGQTLLEGMACGLPAVCTDVASLPEVVENGVTGWGRPIEQSDGDG